MWRKTRRGGAAPRSTRAPCGIRVTPSVSGSGKQVEEASGWMKTVGGLRRTRYRGRERVQMHAYLVAAAYNLIRIAKLCPAPA
jgi:IS5 family transposase